MNVQKNTMPIMKPFNYGRLDKKVSRSSLPYGTGPLWLKYDGVTDVINFRTLRDKKANEEEKRVFESLGIKYHQIPSITANPTEEKVLKFLDLVDNIKAKGGKAHIHCVQGANRTGMYSFIYKSMNNIDKPFSNFMEWYAMGFDKVKYPHLMAWATDFVLKHRK